MDISVCAKREVTGVIIIIFFSADTVNVELRIHEHTQRGSNDTIKLAAGKKDTTSALKSSGNNMN